MTGPTTAPPAFSMRLLGRSAAVLAIATTIGQLVVIGRELFVAAEAGTSVRLDALLVALVLPVLLSGVLFSGLGAALVPLYVETVRLEGRASAQRFVGGVLGWVLILALSGVAIVILLGGPLLFITGPGLGPEARAAALEFTPAVALLVVLVPVGTLLSAVCQAQQRFGTIALSQMAGSVISAVTTVGLWASIGMWALALAFVTNAAAVVLVLIVGLVRSGDLPVPSLKLRRAMAERFLRHLVPMTAGNTVLQFNVLADRAVASLLSVGSLSALRYGEQLIHAPVNVVSSAWSTVIYPALVDTTHSAEDQATGVAANAAIRHVAALFIPIGAAIAALSPLAVQALYQRGAFGTEAATQTTGVVAASAPLLPLIMALSVLVAAHNARRRGALLGTAAVLNATLNLALNVVLAPIIGVAGVALSTSLTLAIVVAFLARRLAQAEPGFGGRDVAGTVIKSLVASAVAAVPVAALAWGGLVPGALPLGAVVIFGLGMAGAAGYLLVAQVIGLREPGRVLSAVAGAVSYRLRRGT